MDVMLQALDHNGEPSTEELDPADFAARVIKAGSFVDMDCHSVRIDGTRTFVVCHRTSCADVLKSLEYEIRDYNRIPRGINHRLRH